MPISMLKNVDIAQRQKMNTHFFEHDEFVIFSNAEVTKKKQKPNPSEHHEVVHLILGYIILFQSVTCTQIRGSITLKKKKTVSSSISQMNQIF